MKTSKLWLICFSAMLTACYLAAQEPTVAIHLDAHSFLYGQPVWATYTISNCSQRTIYLSGQTRRNRSSSLLMWNARAYYGDGKVVPIHKDYIKYVGEGNSFPKHALRPGESVSLSQPVPVTDVTQNELPPGHYELIFSLGFSMTDTPGIWEKKKEARTAFEVSEPHGEDAAWLKDLQRAVLTASKKALRRPDRPSPLGWNEVLEGPVDGIIPAILQKHPTSTYAGYVLARKIPDYSNPLFHPVPPARQLAMARDEGKTYVAFPDKSFEQYFQQLDTFMKGGHVPESLRAVLWSFYGDQLVRRGRFPEAQEAFQRATQGTPPTGGKALAYYERAKGFLEAFEANKQPVQKP